MLSDSLNKHFFVPIVAALLFITTPTLSAQSYSGISVNAIEYNFGTLIESDTPASHDFIVRNTGSTPLVITRITTSCGCARPEWNKNTIAPGNTGTVRIKYATKGRIGPFRKNISVYSNAGDKPLSLHITGTVEPPPPVAPKPAITYNYAIGDLKLSSHKISFQQLHPGNIQTDTLFIRNDGENILSIHTLKKLRYVDIPDVTIRPGEEMPIAVSFITDEYGKMGHVDALLTLEVDAAETKYRGIVGVSANVVDDFSSMTPAMRAQAPSAKYSAKEISLGKTGGDEKAERQLTIANTGKSSLNIYSVSCPDERIKISGGKKKINNGKEATFKIRFRPNKTDGKVETLLTIVCNDPNEPVRHIKITADK
jgi:hypothetical protein